MDTEIEMPEKKGKMEITLGSAQQLSESEKFWNPW